MEPALAAATEEVEYAPTERAGGVSWTMEPYSPILPTGGLSTQAVSQPTVELFIDQLADGLKKLVAVVQKFHILLTTSVDLVILLMPHRVRELVNPKSFRKVTSLWDQDVTTLCSPSGLPRP